nr:hypothetical protein [Tanacetum cinerariifolium]
YDPHKALKDTGIVDSRCFRHMTGNKAHFADYQEFKGGSVAFGGSNERITGKGKMCDKKNKVVFTNTDCLVLSPGFKLPDENQVLLKIPRQHNMYSFNLKKIDPSRDLVGLFAKALIDESNKWHRMLGHVNFKNLNKLVKRNLVRGLPSNIFKMIILVLLVRKESNTRPLVRPRQSDNGTKFKNNELIEFCGLKGIKREYITARTPQQNRVAERKNWTLIETARTMLADSFLPTTFWAEAVNTACYVLDRVLVTKPQNKTHYELLTVENQANKSPGPKEANNSAGTQANDDQCVNSEEIDLHKEHFVLPIWSAYSTTVKSPGDKIEKNTNFKTCEKPVSQVE